MNRGDHRLPRPRAGGGARLVETPGVCVEVRAPRADPLRLDTLLLERVAHAVRQRGSCFPVAGPRLDDELVQQDVPERRFIALVAGLLLGIGETRSSAVEVVDVAQPLPKLEDDAVVDGDRRRRPGRFEPVRALGRLRIEPAAEEQVRAHPRCERRRGECRLLCLDSVEELAGGACRAARLLEIHRAGVHRELREAASALDQAVGSLERLLGQADGRRLALVPVVDLGERHQCPRPLLACQGRVEQFLEDRPCAGKVAREIQVLGELELQSLRLVAACRHQP